MLKKGKVGLGNGLQVQPVTDEDMCGATYKYDLPQTPQAELPEKIKIYSTIGGEKRKMAGNDGNEQTIETKVSEVRTDEAGDVNTNAAGDLIDLRKFKEDQERVDNSYKNINDALYQEGHIDKKTHGRLRERDPRTINDEKEIEFYGAPKLLKTLPPIANRAYSLLAKMGLVTSGEEKLWGDITQYTIGVKKLQEKNVNSQANLRSSMLSIEKQKSENERQRLRSSVTCKQLDEQVNEYEMLNTKSMILLAEVPFWDEIRVNEYLSLCMTDQKLPSSLSLYEKKMEVRLHLKNAISTRNINKGVCEEQMAVQDRKIEGYEKTNQQLEGILGKQQYAAEIRTNGTIGVNSVPNPQVLKSNVEALREIQSAQKETRELSDKISGYTASCNTMSRGIQSKYESSIQNSPNGDQQNSEDPLTSSMTDYQAEAQKIREKTKLKLKERVTRIDQELGGAYH